MNNIHPPLADGDVVRINGNDHLGLHRVDSCEWFEHTIGDTNPYWLCQTTEIREPIDWSQIPEGATGIVASCGWRGSAEHLTKVSP